jgi:peptide/nickel transport system permease protein
MQMFIYVGRRMLMMIPTVLVMSFIVFFIIQLPPGDYITTYVAHMSAQGENFTLEMVAALRSQYGLDRPWPLQYLYWIRGIIFHGDFGYSFSYYRPVWSVIMDRLGLTVAISLITMLFTYLVSIPIGIYSANHQYSPGDYLFTFIGFIGMAVPHFLLAIVLMFMLYKWTGSAYVGLFSSEMLQNGIHLYNLPDFLMRLVLPVVIIGSSGTCGVIRTVRAQMLDEQSKQYTLTARAKGVSERKITYKYCLRAALNPVVSGMATSLSGIFTGSTITAIVMNLAIQGPVLYTALVNQDMYLAGTILLVQALLIVIGTFISDIILGILDPKIRSEQVGEG